MPGVWGITNTGFSSEVCKQMNKMPRPPHDIMNAVALVTYLADDDDSGTQIECLMCLFGLHVFSICSDVKEGNSLSNYDSL